MTTPPVLQALEDWPEGVFDRNGRELEPGYLVRVLGHDGGRSHEGHVVACTAPSQIVQVWQDGAAIAPHHTMFLIRIEDDDGRPLRWLGEENDDMAKKAAKKTGKKNSKASAPKRSRKAATPEPEAEAAANDAPDAPADDEDDAPPPEPTRKHGRQGNLPGTTEPDVEEIETLCAEFKDHDDSIIEHKRETTKLRGAIAKAMEKHDRQLYEYANKRFVYQPGAPKLKVQTIKDDED